MITNSSARGHRKKVKWGDLPLSNSDKSLFYTTADWIYECNAKGSKRGKKKKKSCKLAGEGTGQSYLVRGGMGGKGRQPPLGASALGTRFAPSD